MHTQVNATGSNVPMQQNLVKQNAVISIELQGMARLI